MKYDKKNIYLLLATLIIGIISLHPYTAFAIDSAEEVEVETDELEDIEYDTNDTEGVFLDMDVTPQEYDSSVYTSALSTVYLEETSDSTQELSLFTDHSITPEQIKVNADEENGVLTCVFPNTYNAIGEWKKSIDNSYVKNISVASTGTDITVTVKYHSLYVLSTTYDEYGIVVTFSNVDYSMRIQLPEEITKAQIKDTDYYYDHKFVLTIPGKWKSFYEQHPVISRNNVITSIQITQSGNTTRITVKTSRLQGYKYEQKGDYLLVKVNDPRKIYKNIVVLDAGHGGKDFGATSRGAKEKNINYKIIYTLAKEYFNSQTSDVKAYWSRYNDKFISLSARAGFASEVKADLFVSLHMNSAPNTRANGMEVYYARSNNKTSSMGLSSRTLAQRMHEQLEENLSIPSRGVKKAEFYVLRHNTVPAILIELGFISGNKDHGKITSASYQKKAAENIYNCISNVFKTYPTGR